MSIQGTKLNAIADAIRTQEGTSAVIPANTFADRILALSVGVQNPSVILPAASTQGEQLARIAEAIRAKEGSAGNIPANEFADRIADLKKLNPPRLPEGYTEIEYVDFDGNTRIDFNIGAFLYYYKTILTLELFPSPKNGGFMGARCDTATNRSGVGFIEYVEKQALEYNGGNIYLTSYYGAYTVSSSIKNPFGTYLPAQSGKMEIICDGPNNEMTIGAETKEISVVASKKMLPTVSIGAVTFSQRKSASGTSTTTYEYMAYRLYNIYMTKRADGSDAYNFIPCIRDSDQKVGLYELIYNRFWTPTVGALIAGPKV